MKIHGKRHQFFQCCHSTGPSGSFAKAIRKFCNWTIWYNRWKPTDPNDLEIYWIGKLCFYQRDTAYSPSEPIRNMKILSSELNRFHYVLIHSIRFRWKNLLQILGNSHKIHSDFFLRIDIEWIEKECNHHSWNHVGRVVDRCSFYCWWNI